jgi:sugar phosphate isomerase/epimerase
MWSTGGGVARIGLMLYTVREECARDFAGTLRAVAGLGYEGVELFDLYGHDAATVRTWLDELRLVACGRHTSLDALETGLPTLAAECATLGTDRLVLSWIEPPSSTEAAKVTAARLAGIARECAQLGLRFGFHNHDGEVRPLDGGASFVDELLAGDDVFLELDLGWAWTAGVDPVALLRRAAGRCPLVHVKDFASADGREFRPVGEGAIDYGRILPVAVEAGVEWLLVEQDETDGPALEAAARSLEAVRAAI